MKFKIYISQENAILAGRNVHGVIDLEIDITVLSQADRELLLTAPLCDLISKTIHYVGEEQFVEWKLAIRN
jgi:hypothetical protein